MTDTRKTMQQALEALENFARFQRMMMDGPDASDKLLAEDYAETAFLQGAQAIPALRSALAQQGGQVPKQLYDSACKRADMWQRIAQQGEQQPVKTKLPQIIELMGHCPECGATEAHFKQAAPAAQPTCKQDLQVPTVKESLSVETEQERYVRMCPDIECGRKKQCTRMVGVSCMSRADIGAHGIGADK